MKRKPPIGRLSSPVPGVQGVEDEPCEPASPVSYLSEFQDWESDDAEQPMKIQIKRAYERPLPEDGNRFLVDRLWPRGVKKDGLALTAWLKDAAPSGELRRWFGHDASKWNEFCRRYRAGLRSHPGALRPLREAIERGTVTLVYSARDEEHNQAVALREFLLKTRLPSGAKQGGGGADTNGGRCCSHKPGP